MLSSDALRHAILSQLDHKPMHGYRLRKTASRHSWLWPIQQSSIYPVLHDLEDDGLVTHETELHDGRMRKVYSITDRGRLALRDWLAIASKQDLTFSDTVAFKVSVHRDDMSAGSVDWMRSTLDKLRQKIEECQHDVAAESESSEYSQLAVEYGIELLQLRAQLLERVLNRAEQRQAAIHPQTETPLHAARS